MSVDDSLSTGIIAGLVAGVVVLIILIVAGVILILCIYRKKSCVDSSIDTTMRSHMYEDPAQLSSGDVVMQQSSAYDIMEEERRGNSSEIRMQESRAYESLPTQAGAGSFPIHSTVTPL